MAGSLITRDSWTNDTGTPALPNADGTILNNSVLQNHVYARIDELLSGAGAYTTLRFGGLIAAEGFGTNDFSAGGTGVQLLQVRNSTAGTGNSTQLRLRNDDAGASSGALFVQTSTSYSPGAQYFQDALTVECNRNGGMVIAATGTGANAVIRFMTNPTPVVRGVIGAFGNLTWTANGAHTFTADENNATALEVRQLNSGVTASAQLQLGNNGVSAACRLIHTSTGFTPGSVYTADAFIVDAQRVGGITISASHASGAIRFHTGGSTTYQWIMHNSGAFEMADPDVAHGITTVAATAAYGQLFIYDVVAGGLIVAGLTELNVGLRLAGMVTTETAVRTTSALAPIILDANLRSGASTVALAGDQNLVVIRNATTTRFILDSDGDSHQDVGTAWTNFDDRDDCQALTALAYHVSRADDPWKARIRSLFGRDLEAFGPRSVLEAAKLVVFNADGHHFVNMSKLTMLHTGALRQLHERLARVERLLLAEA